MNIVFHMANKTAWQDAKRRGIYTHPSLESDRFIHFSTNQQLLRIANLFYRGTTDFVLLCIDSDQLLADLVYEAAPGQGDERFPHLYGPLNLDAVVKVIDFQPNEEGLFTFPAELRHAHPEWIRNSD